MIREEIFTGAPDAEAASAETLALDALLDAALADTFPASDPPALCSPHSRRGTTVRTWRPAEHDGLKSLERMDESEGSDTT